MEFRFPLKIQRTQRIPERKTIRAIHVRCSIVRIFECFANLFIIESYPGRVDVFITFPEHRGWAASDCGAIFFLYGPFNSRSPLASCIHLLIGQEFRFYGCRPFLFLVIRRVYFNQRHYNAWRSECSMQTALLTGIKRIINVDGRVRAIN